MPSTLYRVAASDEAPPARVVGVLADGSLLIHGEPAQPIPATAVEIVRDGATPWTWNALADDRPDLAAIVMPHEWAGEPTAADLDASRFPLLSPSEGV